jgi:pyruvate dehydrogenase E1 component alpha subunit
MERCPVASFKELLVRLGVATTEELEFLVSQIDADLDEALSFAQNSPLPRPEEVVDHVYYTVR